MLLSPQLGSGGMVAEGRRIVIRSEDILLLVVAFSWLAKTAVNKELGLTLKTPLNRPILAYVAATAVATLIGYMTGTVAGFGGAFYVLKYVEYFVVYYMVVNNLVDRRQAWRLVTAAFLTAVIVSLIGLSQIPSGQRVSAPFEGKEGEPNTLGGYLVFMLAIVTGLLMTPGALLNKLPLLILMGVGGIALQATLSRSSFLAAGVVILGVLGLVWRKNPLYPALFLIALLTAPWWTPHSVTERIMYTFAQPQEEGQIRLGSVRVDTSTSDRLRSWRQSLDYFQRSPLWGAGVTGGPFIDAMYPRVLVETGLLGTCAFLVLLW